MDQKLFFPDPDPTLTLISDPDSDPGPDPAFFYEKYIRNSDNLNITKKPDCFEKFIWTADHLNIAKKQIFFLNLYIFTALYLLVGNRT